MKKDNALSQPWLGLSRSCFSLYETASLCAPVKMVCVFFSIAIAGCAANGELQQLPASQQYHFTPELAKDFQQKCQLSGVSASPVIKANYCNCLMYTMERYVPSSYVMDAGTFLKDHGADAMKLRYPKLAVAQQRCSDAAWMGAR